MAHQKEVVAIHGTGSSHWVGDGFPVRSLFSYSEHGREMSPFLLLDYAGPREFPPTPKQRGVGEHPHRGFETVTIVYQGEVEHRDSTGRGGTIGPGDVQWMTAGAGILHQEFHSRQMAEEGGTLEMVQLWVNLPARDKLTPPRYQTLLDQAIPGVELEQGAGRLRVIAGEFAGRRGPARPFTPLDVWGVRLRKDSSTRFEFPDRQTVAVVALRGGLLVQGRHILREAQVAVFDRRAGEVSIEANDDATLLVLAGEPIEEPIVGYGPFVMNTDEEIAQAVDDVQGGRFGAIPPETA